MKIKSWVLLLCFAGLALLILSVLAFFTEKPNSYKNGFNRQHLAIKVVPIGLKRSLIPLNRIAGISANHIYFAPKAANQLCLADWSLEHQDTIAYSRPFNMGVLNSYELAVDSPLVHIYAGNLSAMLTYHLHDTVAEASIFKIPLFTRAIQISEYSLIIRGFDSSRRKQVLEKLDTRTGNILAKADIIPEQHDGGFGTDGWLQYDSSSQRILYVCTFDNRIFCLDSNLHAVYMRRTIDTINSNPVETHQFNISQKEGSLKPATPLKFVNRDCCVSQGHLFVVSALEADNDQGKDFRDNSVVDVYSISDGQYQGSFYVPNAGEKKLRYIRIVGDKMVALYTDDIGTFRLTM